MQQSALPYKYETEKNKSGLTALGGLPVYLDLASVAGLRGALTKHLEVRRGTQGWDDSQVVTALILLNLAGGECVEDVETIEAEDGFCRIIRRVEHHDLPRHERRAIEKRWRKEKKRTLPSASSVFRYLYKFHDQKQEEFRREGKSLISAAN